MQRTTESNRLHRILATWPLVALGLVAVVAPPKTTHESDAAPFASGARIAIDPDSGVPIGMPSGSAGLEQSLSRSSAGLTSYRLPDGGTGVHLQGRFMSASMVRMNADGQLETVCTADHDHATHFLQADAAEADTAPNENVEWEVK